MADDTAELRSRLERALAEAATSGASIGDAFLQLNRLLAPEPDRMQIWRLIRALAEPYPNLRGGAFRRRARRIQHRPQRNRRRRERGGRRSIARWSSSPAGSARCC